MSQVNNCSQEHTSLAKVWNMVAQNLRSTRDELRKINNSLYGRQDPLLYISQVKSALQTALGETKTTSCVNGYKDLEIILENLTNMKSTANIDNYLKTLNDFSKISKTAMLQIKELKVNFDFDVLEKLESYCSKYEKLGCSDDDFFKSLKLKNVSIKTHLKKFVTMFTHMQEGQPISSDLFCDCFFSQELAIEFDCAKYPILRVLPDLIQKLEVACDIASDWLRSDKVYIEEIEKEISSCRSNLHCAEQQLEMAREEYSRLYASLKERKAAQDDDHHDEAEIVRASKKLRVAGRHKQKLLREVEWTNHHLDDLNNLLRNRLYPSDNKTCNYSQMENDDQSVSVPNKTKGRQPSSSRAGKRKRSLEMEKAFKIVKNNIGLGWKDLARSLPYTIEKDPTELNTEVKIIEYENQGQLREQAYQALVKWQRCNGRRASVEVLAETLKQLKETRLAEEIEHKVLGREL